MTTTNNLPVYKESYDLIEELFRYVKEFNREYKYTLGERVKTEMIALVIDIYRANSSIEKRGEHIKSARERVEVIRLLLRLLRDLRQLPLEKFVSLNVKIESVSRQLTGWLKKSQAK
ncbi:four helix bundle protein [Candidatus Kaiserbacteria bacterium]|nr:four helix bundle protein [Candidatus Kaiserbacteria bacterium]USN88457.1 MAG: four helix bundle protein [Candidatus Nomurabacteria bacterium]